MMERGGSEDMQSFDQAIVRLYRTGRIDFEEAKANADSPRQFHLLVHGDGGGQALSVEAPSPESRRRESAALPEIEMPG
jgi:twitching motility protein PilU